MRKVCKDYAAIFDDIEEKPSCVIRWNLSDRSVICKPRFVPRDTGSCVQPKPAQSEDHQINANAGLPSVEETGDEQCEASLVPM